MLNEKYGSDKNPDRGELPQEKSWCTSDGIEGDTAGGIALSDIHSTTISTLIII